MRTRRHRVGTHSVIRMSALTQGTEQIVSEWDIDQNGTLKQIRNDPDVRKGPRMEPGHISP